MKLGTRIQILCLPALCAVLAPAARGQCTDAYEPNETCAAAAPLTPDAQPVLQLTFPSHPSGPDTDCFRTSVPVGETLELLVDAFAPPVFTIEVFDAPDCAQPIATGTLHGPPLRLVNGGAAPLELWIRIGTDPDGSEFPCETYQLVLRSFVDPCPGLVPDAFEPNDDLPSASPLSPGSYVDLEVQGGSADFYRIAAPTGSLVVLTMAQNLNEYPGVAPTVTFIDASTGQAIQGAFPNGTTSYVNLTANAEVGLRVDSTTALTCSSYDMTIEVSETYCSDLLPDAFEDNDSCAASVPLPPGEYDDLNVATGDADFYRIDLTPGDVMVAVIEFDAALASGVRSQLYGGCSINDWYPVYSVPDRLTAVLADDGVGSSWYTLTAGINLQEFDPEAPCAEYDLTLRTYSQTIGTPYCPALPNGSGEAAVLEAYGSSLEADGELALIATHLPQYAPGLIFFGPNQVQLPLGNGLRCVGGGTTRLKPVQFAGNRAYIFHVIDFDTTTAQLLAPGSTWHFQAWFRDGSSSNLSNAVTMTFQ